MSKKEKRLRFEAKKAHARALEKYGCQAHYGNSKQKKAVADAAQALRRHGRKLGRVESEDEQPKLSASIFALADDIEERQNYFEEGRTDLAQVVLQPMSAERESATSGMLPESITHMVIQGCAKQSDGAVTDPNKSKAIYESLHYKSKEGATLGLHLIETDLKLVVSSQRTALLAHFERVLRISDLHACATACHNITCGIGAEDIVIQSLDGIKAAEDGSGDICMKNGWSSDLWVDLCTLHVLGKIAVQSAQASR